MQRYVKRFRTLNSLVFLFVSLGRFLFDDYTTEEPAASVVCPLTDLTSLSL